VQIRPYDDAMIDPERVQLTIADGVADVRLVRADKRNALDRRMFQSIIAAGEQVAADRSVRAVVLSGDGKAFCAGLDTSLFAAMAERDPDAGATSGGTSTSDTTSGALRVEAVQAVRVWVDMAAPVIAAVHGVAVGGGFQLALGADLRVVAPDAQLGVFEIKWGIVPDMCGTQLLPRLVGPDVAKDLMFTGRVVTGAEAQTLGLVTRLSDDPRADALALAAEIASRNPDAIKVMKRLVDASWTLSFDDGVREERDQTEGMIGSKNQLEAVIANLEQRPGNFED
jgi:enoyl-CoA hydratase/carnithine racemase